MAETVSIIIPIYNGEEYLDRCLQSVQKQTYKDLEIILINDGSFDKSNEICKTYLLSDSRFQIYEIENQGVANARNYGLKYVTGDYIQFVDCDDFLISTATETLVKAIQDSNIDMVVSGYNRIFQTFQWSQKPLDKTKQYSSVEYLIQTLQDPGHHYYGVVWNKLFRTSIIKINNFQFRQDVSLGEDFIFNIQYLHHCKNVLVIKNKLYNYNCIRGNSLSRSNEKLYEMSVSELRNRKSIWQQYVSSFQKHDLYEVNRLKMEQYWVMYYVRQLYHLNHEFKNWTFDQKTRWFYVINNDETIEKCIKHCKHYKITILVYKFTIKTFMKTKTKLLLSFLRCNQKQ